MCILVWCGRMQKLGELQSFSQHDFWTPHGSDKKAYISIAFPASTLAFVPSLRMLPVPQSKQAVLKQRHWPNGVAARSTVWRKITGFIWGQAGRSGHQLATSAIAVRKLIYAKGQKMIRLLWTGEQVLGPLGWSQLYSIFFVSQRVPRM